MGERQSEQGAETARAGIGQVLLFALLWIVPLGALIAFASLDALRQGAASTFRYVGF